MHVVRCMVRLLGSPVSVSDTQAPLTRLHIGHLCMFSLSRRIQEGWHESQSR